jgi:uncharacterized protein
MEAKQIHEENGQKTFALVFDTGDEVIAGLSSFAAENDLNAASITAIGAFFNATLGYFDMERREYKQIPVHEQVEVLSLIGDIAPRKTESHRCTPTWFSADPTARRRVGTYWKPTCDRRWK